MTGQILVRYTKEAYKEDFSMEDCGTLCAAFPGCRGFDVSTTVKTFCNLKSSNVTTIGWCSAMA